VLLPREVEQVLEEALEITEARGRRKSIQSCAAVDAVREHGRALVRREGADSRARSRSGLGHAGLFAILLQGPQCSLSRPLRSTSRLRYAAWKRSTVEL
jgi:hypothetical protein